MTPEQSVVASAVHAWKLNIERADTLFSGLSDQQLRAEVAPGKNRLVYLWGHLIAVHDGMSPLLDLGRRLHPELDAAFLTGADKAVADLPSAGELERMWDEVNGRLLAGFSTFTAADWAKKHTVVSEAGLCRQPAAQPFLDSPQPDRSRGLPPRTVRARAEVRCQAEGSKLITGHKARGRAESGDVVGCRPALGAHEGITGKTGANPARSRHCE